MQLPADATRLLQQWYGPNNAILVVVGNVNPDTTIASVRKIYGSIGKRPVPAHPNVEFQPVKAESFTLDSNLPYTLTFLAYRFPGTDSPDFAASRILADALASQRGNLFDLVPQGKALAAEFGLAETYPKASVGYAVGAFRPARIPPRFSPRSGRFLRTTRKTASRRTWWKRPSEAKSQARSFREIRFPVWRRCGRRRWQARDVSLPTKTSRR